MVYHAGERRAYLLGGSTRRENAYHYFDDIWYWSGADWMRSDAMPFARSSHRVVYHGGRNSLVLFGGGSGRTFAADGVLWEWRATRWGVLGERLGGGLAEPAMCYDWRRARVVIFGGWDAASRMVSVTWEWTGQAVVEVARRGPSPRAGHALFYDPRRQRCLLFGGRSDGEFLADTWEWDGVEWRRLEAAGPPARWFFGTATDHASRRIVIFGGSGPDGDLGDTWSWDGERWELLSRDGPSPRGMPRMAFGGDRIVLFGGRVRTTEGYRDQNDTWVLDGRIWTRRR